MEIIRLSEYDHCYSLGRDLTARNMFGLTLFSGGPFFGRCFFSLGIFYPFYFLLLLCFFLAFMLSCFSAFLLSCFLVFLLSLLFCFSVLLRFCFCWFAFLLFCFSVCLLLCFFASLLFCFSAGPHYLNLTLHVSFAILRRSFNLESLLTIKEKNIKWQKT